MDGSKRNGNQEEPCAKDVTVIRVQRTLRTERQLVADGREGKPDSTILADGSVKLVLTRLRLCLIEESEGII